MEISAKNENAPQHILQSVPAVPSVVMKWTGHSDYKAMTKFNNLLQESRLFW